MAPTIDGVRVLGLVCVVLQGGHRIDLDPATGSGWSVSIGPGDPYDPIRDAAGWPAWFDDIGAAMAALNNELNIRHLPAVA